MFGKDFVPGWVELCVFVLRMEESPHSGSGWRMSLDLRVSSNFWRGIVFKLVELCDCIFEIVIEGNNSSLCLSWAKMGEFGFDVYKVRFCGMLLSQNL